MGALEVVPATPLERIELPETRLRASVLTALTEIVGVDHVRTDAYERAFHAAGQSFRDVVAVRAGQLDFVSDAVVYPETTAEVVEVVALANEHRIAVVPFGGGSSVVGGVEPRTSQGQDAAITLDTTRMNRLLRIDETSRTATAQAGIYGPDLEAALAAHGYTLGHFPQSFEFSTLGGWIAARGAGQTSNGYGVAASWLVAAEVVGPSGTLETAPFPNSAAGPDLRHLVAGSEGVLGVITEATFRVRPVPEQRDYRAYLFKDFERGREAIRGMVQQGLGVAMVRLSDADETRFFGAFNAVGKTKSSGRKLAEQVLGQRGFGNDACVMLVGVEGSMAKVVSTVARTTAFALAHGAMPLGAGTGKKWLESRFEMPYLRDPMLDRGIAVDTLETCTEWSNLPTLYEGVGNAIRAAIAKQDRRGMVMCHISHAYPGGASLYYTYVYPMDRSDPLGQWSEIKRAASDAIRDHGGTLSHHHGVGVDHLPWMEAEKGALGMRILRGIKAEIDPHGIMNPGKLVS
jgi:alkyldihydroxyacetonephosphate synthase